MSKVGGSTSGPPLVTTNTRRVNKQRPHSISLSNSTIETVQSANIGRPIDFSAFQALTAPATQSGPLSLTNTACSAVSQKEPTYYGELVLGPDTGLCWQPVKRARAWDRIITAPVNRRIDAILTNQKKYIHLHNLVRGADASSYHDAGAILMQSIVEHWWKIEQIPQTAQERWRQKRAFLTLARNILLVDLGADLLRLDEASRSVIKSLPLMKPLYTRDIEIIDLIFSFGQKDFDHHVSTRDRLPTENNLSATSFPNDYWKEAGFASGMLSQTTMGAPHFIKVVAQRWDTFIVRSLSACTFADQMIARAAFTVGCDDAGIQAPLENLFDTLLQTPQGRSWSTFVSLIEYAASKQWHSLLEMTAKKAHLWQCTIGRNSFAGLSALHQQTFSHILASNTDLRESDTKHLLAIAAGAGPNHLALCPYEGNADGAERVLQPLRASCHAALSGRKDVAHFLLAQERKCEIIEFHNDTHMLSRVAKDIDRVVLAFESTSLADIVVRAMPLLSSTLQFHINTRKRQLFVEVVGHSFDESLRKLSIILNELYQWKDTDQGPLSIEQCTDSFYDSLCRSPSQATESPSSSKPEPVKYLQSTNICSDPYCSSCTCDPEKEYEITSQSVFSQHQSVFDLRTSLKAALDIFAEEVQQIVQQRQEINPRFVDDENYISTNKFIGQEYGSDQRSLSCLAIAQKSSAMAILLDAPALSHPYDLAGVYRYALTLCQRTDPKSQAAGQRIMRVVHKTNFRGTTLWGCLYAALKIKDSAKALFLTALAQEKSIKLNDVNGPKCAAVLHLAAMCSSDVLKAVLCLVDEQVAQRRYFETPNELGDTLYHTVARCHGSCMEDLSTKSEFSPARLVKDQNISGLNALEEACLVASHSMLRVLWARAPHWDLYSCFDEALIKTARKGSLDCILFLGRIVAQELRFERLLGKINAALQEPIFPAPHDTTRENTSQNDMQLSDPTGGMAERLYALEFPTLAMSPCGISIDKNSAESLRLQLEYNMLRQAQTAQQVEDALERLYRAQIRIRNKRDLSLEDKKICHFAINYLEIKFFGAFFGRHFYSHRDDVSDEQLQIRMKRLGLQGATRFGPDDAPAILRVRQRAMHRAKEVQQQRKEAGQISAGIIQLLFEDDGIHGSGFGCAVDDPQCLFFDSSRLVTAVIQLMPTQDLPHLLSMYPMRQRTQPRHVHDEFDCF